MRKRLALLVLVAGIVLVARFGFRRPVDVDLALGLGVDAPRVRDLTLVLTDADEHVARELHLHYPKGAPADEKHRVRLKPGRYTVGARLALDGEPERHLSRPLAVDDAGTYVVEFSK